MEAQEQGVSGLKDSENKGMGVRVLAGGAWGFASTPHLTRDAALSCARQAVNLARAASLLRKSPVRLAESGVVQGTYRTAVQIDPFAVSLADKADLLVRACQAGKSGKDVVRVVATLALEREEKLLCTSEGTRVFQVLTRVAPALRVTATAEGRVKSRGSAVPPLNIGWEHVIAADLPGQAPRLAEEAREHCRAPAAPSGPTTLVLSPSHLCLTLHETVGHATEGDRVLGWEADFAGTTFVRPQDVGSLRYGSDKIHIVADRSRPTLRATCGWDDDGVPTTSADLIREGILVSLQTTRETAPLLGKGPSSACCQADSWESFPFLKIPNVSLEAGPPGSPTVEELIADTKEGILIDGRGSFSIDQQRLHFQFGGDAFYRIHNGQLSGMLLDVTYNGLTPTFWNACDAVTGSGTWEPHGITEDGKGQPQQRGQMSHGSPWARFRNVDVGGKS